MQSHQLHEQSSPFRCPITHLYLTDSITFRFVTNYTSATRSSSNAHSQPHQHKAHLYKCFLSMRPNHTTNTFAASSSLGSSIPPTFQSSLMSYRRYIIYRLTFRTYFSSLLFRPSSKSVRIVRIRIVGFEPTRATAQQSQSLLCLANFIIPLHSLFV